MFNLNSDEIYCLEKFKLKSWDINDLCYNELRGDFTQEQFGKIINKLINKELIENDGDEIFITYRLSEKAKLEFEKIENQRIQHLRNNQLLQQKNDLKQKLEIENLKLQKEALEYQISIRNKEDRIKKLGIELQQQALSAQKRNNTITWVSAIIGSIIGAVATLLATQSEMLKQIMSKLTQ